ncbi:SURF1 family protein [Sedimentitalea todarodis]|uniref:SURF1-like protein n=1 Tax=Sedimentitalea todarodis TaxID=1631240 RepID=A0ABU3V8J2_9RHOB|nr:SURF1 family protein [Sedimentitalea todarodis]MDU9002487.1 SURF1 family protein [Sedimentitalea todarodis]
MARAVFLVFFGLAGFGILISLGTWQIQRLSWKQDVLAEIDSRISAEPASLPMTPDPEADKYMPVMVSGTMSDAELHVLVSVKHVGPGYRIIALFQTDDGRLILLDRGFVATEDKTATRLTGHMTVVGNLHWPDEIDSYTPEPDVAGNTWFARDVPRMAAALGTEPVLLIARSVSDPDITPLPVDTVGIPNDHLQYAITWFSLALIWAAMTTYFLWRTRAKPESRGQ